MPLSTSWPRAGSGRSTLEQHIVPVQGMQVRARRQRTALSCDCQSAAPLHDDDVDGIADRSSCPSQLLYCASQRRHVVIDILALQKSFLLLESNMPPMPSDPFGEDDNDAIMALMGPQTAMKAKQSGPSKNKESQWASIGSSVRRSSEC